MLLSLLSPYIIPGLILTFGLVTTLVLLQGRNAIAIGISGAIAVLVFVPSGALAHLPFGSFVPPVVAITLLCAAFVGRMKSLRFPRMFPLAAAFYGITLFSSLLMGGIDPYYGLMGLAGLLALLLAGNAAPHEAETIRKNILRIAVVQAVLAVAEVWTGPLLGDKITMSVENPFLAGLDRVQGTLGHPLVLSVVLLLGLALTLTSPMALVKRIVLSALFVPAIVLAGSSSSAVTAAALVAWAIVARKTVAMKLMGGLVLVAVVLAVFQTGVRAESLQDDLSGQNISHRVNILMSISGLFTEQGIYPTLFGNGLGHNEHLYDQGILPDYGFSAIDNQWVNALIQSGLVGLMILVAFAVLLFKRAPRLWRTALIPFALMTISFDVLSWYSMAVLLFTIAGLIARDPAAAPVKVRRQDRTHTYRRRKSGAVPV